MNIMHNKTEKFTTQLRHETHGERRNTAKYWFASASLANPYCQSMWMSVCMYVGSRALA